MTDLHAILQAFPAGTKLLVIAAELPDGSRSIALAPNNDNPPSHSAGSAPTPVASDRVGSVDAPSPRFSALERVRHMREVRGNLSLKPRDWSAIIGLSARELRRTIGAGALPSEEKVDGRDHGARVICADAVLSYLTTVYAVERSEMVPPDWWDTVRGRREFAA